jgi:hypothetical protein
MEYDQEQILVPSNMDEPRGMVLTGRSKFHKVASCMIPFTDILEKSLL